MIVYLVEMDGRFETSNDYDEFSNWFVGIYSNLEKAQRASIAELKDQCAEYGINVDDKMIRYSIYDDRYHRYDYETAQGQTFINCCVSIQAADVE